MEKKMQTKRFYLKLKKNLVVLSIFVSSLFLMSSCSILLPYPEAGYRFSAKDSYGQIYYQILNDNEVALLIPDNYDPENIIVPKTIKYGRKNYTVSALYAVDDDDMEIRFNSKNVSIRPIYCKNLVIPETVKDIKFNDSKILRNVIYYGTYYSQLDLAKHTQFIECHWHVIPKYAATFYDNIDIYDKLLNKYTDDRVNINKYRVVNIVDNYNIYEEGHSLEEYLEKSKASVDLAIKREKYNNGLWVPLTNGMVLCFKKLDNSNEVELDDIVLEKGEVDSLIVPKTITDYDNNTYTVTSIEGLAQKINYKGHISQYTQTYVVLPETVKQFAIGGGIPREIICYSPDMEIWGYGVNQNLDVFHLPQGQANKIMEKTGELFPCVEIVDNYDIYQEGNSLAEYIAKSRVAAKKAKEDCAAAAQAALAAEKAAEEKKAAEWRTKQEAEAKRIRKELTSQYGAKYVNDLFNNGKLVIGMPIGLVRYGLKNNLFKKPHLYYMNLEHQSANSESYELRGSYDGFSGSIYLGMVFFSNGKVSSIRWANY